MTWRNSLQLYIELADLSRIDLLFLECNNSWRSSAEILKLKNELLNGEELSWLSRKYVQREIEVSIKGSYHGWSIKELCRKISSHTDWNCHIVLHQTSGLSILIAWLWQWPLPGALARNLAACNYKISNLLGKFPPNSFQSGLCPEVSY